MKVVPIRQRYSKSCGPACLQMIAKAFGHDLTEKIIIKNLGGLKSFGVCTVKMTALARAMGFKADCFTFSKKRRGLAFCPPGEELIHQLHKSKSAVLLCVDPALLAGAAASRAFHNIVLIRYGKRFSSYADPADGKIHRILSSRLLDAWKSTSKRASAHTVTINR